MGVLRPKQAFVTVDKKGVKHRFGVDTLVDENDPIVKGRESLFESVDVVAGREPVTGVGPRTFDETEIAVAQKKRGRRSRPRRGADPRKPVEPVTAVTEPEEQPELTEEQLEALAALSPEELAALEALTDEERAALAELAAAESTED